MFRLTREVRFAINFDPPIGQDASAANGFGGWPPLAGRGQFFSLEVTVSGDLQPDSNYLLNIKQIDDAVRNRIVPEFQNRLASTGHRASLEALLLASVERLAGVWLSARLERLRLSLTPYLAITVEPSEPTMIQLSQKFEFAASHRLHNPALSPDDNLRLFGKCNNPHGHGHNYELQVTVASSADAARPLHQLPVLEQVVQRVVIGRFDHRHLNIELPEFRDLNPTVENIAKVIYRLLNPALSREAIRLLGVTVWETPKTSCHYTEPADATSLPTN